MIAWRGPESSRAIVGRVMAQWSCSLPAGGTKSRFAKGIGYGFPARRQESGNFGLLQAVRQGFDGQGAEQRLARHFALWGSVLGTRRSDLNPGAISRRTSEGPPHRAA